MKKLDGRLISAYEEISSALSNKAKELKKEADAMDDNNIEELDIINGKITRANVLLEAACFLAEKENELLRKIKNELEVN